MTKQTTYYRSQFNENVQNWIRNAFNSNIDNASFFLRSLPGIYPERVVFYLEKLIKKGNPLKKTALSILNQIQTRRNRPPSILNDPLPFPHPLDYEWRFSSPSQKRIISLINFCYPKKNKIALLGSPSLALPLLKSKSFDKILLVESNRATCETIMKMTKRRVEVLCLDITKEEIKTSKVSFVFLDPPWYEDFILPFLNAASCMCEKGGYVFSCLPPLGTKLGVKSERDRIIKASQKMGLELIKINTGLIYFDTPLFELNSLAKRGIYSCIDHWRSADLAIFLKKEDSRLKWFRQNHPLLLKWDEVVIKKIRIRIKQTKIKRKFKDPRLTSILPDDILPSVSRSNPYRRNIDVWTSGNRVFRCKGLNLLKVILVSFKNRKNLNSNIQKAIGIRLTVKQNRLVAIANQQIKQLIKTELKGVYENN